MKKRMRIKVNPRSNKNELAGKTKEGLTKIKLKASPVDGEANKELIKFLSKEWKIPQSNIEIIRGKTSKIKTIELTE